MQIQRVQSLYLLLATVLLVVFLFIPFGYSVMMVDGEERIVEDWCGYQMLGMAIPAAIAAVLALVDIFLFKNFPLQKLVAKLDILLILVTVGITIYTLVSGFNDVTPGDEIVNTKWGGGGLLLLAALIAVGMALSRITSDEKLLKSMDRLR